MQLAINYWLELFIRVLSKVMLFPWYEKANNLIFLEGVFLFSHVVLLDVGVSSAHLLILRSVQIPNLVPVHESSCETVLNS